MSKVFKKGKPRPIDPREWKKNTPTLTFFNDNTGQQQEQQQQCYTSKLVKLINKDSCSSTLSYNLFGIPLHRKHLRQQQHQQTLRGVKQFRRRPKVEIILNPKSEPELQVRVPYGLSRYLKPHQIEGVRFMWKHIVDRKQGCVIAHSMGLGKSIQTVTFVTTLLDVMEKNDRVAPLLNRFESKRILLLAPLTTLSNWVSEFDKWRPSECQETPGGNIYNFADTAEVSTARRLKYLQHWYNDGGILLMSYEQFRSSVTKDTTDQIHKMLLDPGPALLIADEAHRIKNSQSQLTLAVQQIRTRARVCLSGSPIQNNLREFYCVVDFACPGYLPPEVEFKTMYTKPIENIFSDSSSSDIYIAKKQLFKLQLLSSDIILRCGASVLTQELPKKTEYFVSCNLSEFQYKGYVALLRFFKSGAVQESPMINLCVLRAVCNHPSILHQMILNRHVPRQKQPLSIEDSDTSFDEEMFEMDPRITGYSEFSELVKRLFEPVQDMTDMKYSSKIAVIMAIATECRNIHDKLIIVSHSILCLDYLEELFKTLHFQTLRIDGSTPASERQPIIEKFGKDFSKNIMLLSARAGSLGVNITSANRMILCDADWNPQHEEQSVGRVYRYGQTKDVFIYRLYTHTTMEHKLLYQSIHKRGLASRVVDNEKLSPQDKKEMRKYYALPKPRSESSPTAVHDLLSSIPSDQQDTILRNIVQKGQSSNIKDIVLKETLDHGDTSLLEMELAPRDVVKVKSEVRGYLQFYYTNRNH